MSDKNIYMSCGGVGRFVAAHEVNFWKGKGWQVVDLAKIDKPAKSGKENKTADKD